jgi:hypothetical protein
MADETGRRVLLCFGVGPSISSRTNIRDPMSSPASKETGLACHSDSRFCAPRGSGFAAHRLSPHRHESPVGTDRESRDVSPKADPSVRDFGFPVQYPPLRTSKEAQDPCAHPWVMLMHRVHDGSGDAHDAHLGREEPPARSAKPVPERPPFDRQGILEDIDGVKSSLGITSDAEQHLILCRYANQGTATVMNSGRCMS